ncbi:MAG TPA: hypothetical protein VFH51_07705 [Myxococcota bacterium]|nr:hypothetical protein [Myxococcota bacterium]
MTSTPHLRLVHSGPGTAQTAEAAPRQAPLMLVSTQTSPADNIPVGPGRTVPRIGPLATSVTYTALAAFAALDTVRKLTGAWRR